MAYGNTSEKFASFETTLPPSESAGRSLRHLAAPPSELAGPLRPNRLKRLTLGERGDRER